MYNRMKKRERESKREENQEGIDHSSEVLKLPFNFHASVIYKKGIMTEHQRLLLYQPSCSVLTDFYCTSENQYSKKKTINFIFSSHSFNKFL